VSLENRANNNWLEKLESDDKEIERLFQMAGPFAQSIKTATRKAGLPSWRNIPF
jgi:hypothetical protein